VFWYNIRFVAGGPGTIPEPDLEEFRNEATPDELLAKDGFGDRDDFLRLVTFRKLNVPLDNTLYSLHSSRTEFYPHQYRPLIKFLDSQNQRLLIADEVGLGKTIEAGLILAELRARRALRQAMVVCPKALCLKWQEEMWRRFDEEFEILSASDVRRLYETLQERGDIGNLRAIVPLQGLRREPIIELFEANPLPLDLLIFDEAHHLRNSDTLSHRLAAALADNAAGVVLLTATPIQIGNQNLFHLLRLLDPQEFEDFGIFEDRLTANAPIVEAERLIRSSFPPPVADVRDRLRALESGWKSAYFTNKPGFTRVLSELESGHDLTRGDVARLQHDLKELSLLGHVFTRTRKRDVFTSSAKRTARVHHPEVTPAETAFYDAVTDFVRSASQQDNGLIHHFAAITAQRQVASCMPAARNRFVERARERLGDPEASDLGETLGWDFDSGSGEARAVSIPARVLEAAAGLGDEDSKFDALLDALHEMDAAEPGRKLLLFSYFRDTLAYLRRRLEAEGYPCELVTGEIPFVPGDPQKDERTQRMRRFREDPDVRVLLLSEVGSEGLDFQFCHILVNYDLPWNPMLVEQRIGRVDRLGQKSDRIVILNLALPGTIEERILERLYNRIGIFESSIGDLEAILGDEIGRLTRDLLTQRLTPAEEEARIDQAAQAIERRKIEMEKLEAESSRLVSTDSYFEEQLERARTGGELLAPSDLEAFFRLFLAGRFPHARLKMSSQEGVFVLEPDAGLDQAIRQNPQGAAWYRLLHRMTGRSVRLTFRSELAFNDESVELLAAHHPLMVLATEHFRRNPNEVHPVAALRVGPVDGVEPGDYLYTLYEVTIESGRVRKRLEPAFVSAATGEALTEDAGSALLGEMLRRGSAWEPDAGSGARHRALLESAYLAFLERVAVRRQAMEERSADIAETRIASMRAAHRARRAKKQALLDAGRAQRRQDRYLRMLEGTLRNMDADFEQRLGELERERSVRIEFETVGCGLLQVGAA
jgi:superfamily II DNA or RNA helicase